MLFTERGYLSPIQSYRDLNIYIGGLWAADTCIEELNATSSWLIYRRVEIAYALTKDGGQRSAYPNPTGGPCD